LTRDNQSPRFGVVPILNAFPVAATAVIYAGNFVALNASGYAIQLSLTASSAYVIVGVASKDVSNATGANGDVTVECENIYYLDNDTTNPVTASDIARNYCFIVDNHTVGASDGAGTRPLAGLPLRLGSAADSTTGKVAILAGGAGGVSPYASNPLLAMSNAAAFTARGVATNIAALTFAADGTFEADANGALGAQDGLTFVAGQTILLPAGTITTGVVSAANSGPYVLTSVGGASAKFAGRRPSWFADGATITPGIEINVAKGTLFGGTTWRSFADVSQVVGTNDPMLYPLKVTQQITLVAGTLTISNVPVFLAARLGFSCSGAIGGTAAATTTNFAIKASGGITAGGIGTAAVIVEAQSVSDTIVNTDVSVINVTLMNG
jgi:hypothetical protein